MSKVKLVKANTIMPAVKELLTAGNRVRITVTGMSMYPFLRDKKDMVELVFSSFDEIKTGDILLIKRENEEYVLHRVIRKKKDRIYLNGDAGQWWETVYPGQIIAKVSAVLREEKEIDCNELYWRSLSYLWLMAFPFRCLMIGTYKLMRK